ncbi:hypothetical protein KPH14_005912 [Odynerus spinipes]|uniref:Kinesin motor domain-containing protein n=1 Tax=Odynerus spinipes TaxID=1348599 RepID=A0AAD9RJF8_9HYME|nr:hypothetical protein KPH14_005912 [Odynerus spinipes]
MISDDNPSSPIARSSMENVLIEESEVESIDSDVEDSIPESPRVATSPIFDVFLKIKPGTRTTRNNMPISVNKSSYAVLNPTTLRTRFTPCGKPRTPRLSRPSSSVTKTFTFSKIFEPEISQAEFFEQTVKQRIVEFLTGQNSTIMTYGTTNSGKTYTLYGTPDQPGLIPRSIEYVFSAITCTLMPWYKLNPNNTLISLDDYERLQESEKKEKLLKSQMINKEKFTEARRSLENSEQSNENKDSNGESMYAVWLSFAEIYNENIYDLLDFDDSTKSRSLKLIGDKNGLTHVKGLTTVYATTAFEACQILMAGQSRMNTAFTTLNPKSSRSHTIFTMGLLKYQKAYAPHEVEASTLTFCDLAGSGRSKKVGDSSTRLKEARNINNSLLVLGRCLKTVYERQSTKQVTDHVNGPFRESKLTRIFQRALSGHEHVTFLINIDPSTELVNETQSILNISAIARKIGPEIKESRRSARGIIRCPKIADTNTRFDDWKLLTLPIDERKDNQSTQKMTVKPERNSTLQEESLKVALLKRELEVRQELADYYKDKIQRIEETWKERTKEVEEEGKVLLKWSVDQIESFYTKRIDSIMYGKKRKRDELSYDDKDTDSSLHEDWQAGTTSKIGALKDSLKKLQDEHRAVLADKNTCSYELALLKKELKDFQDLAQSEMSNSNVIDDDPDRNSNSLASKLKSLIDEKNSRITILREDLEEIKNKYLNTKEENEIVDEESSKSTNTIRGDPTEIIKLKEELSKKTAVIHSLTIKLESCEKELNQTEADCKDVENRNVELLEKMEALEGAMRQMERKGKDSSTPRPPYYLEEASIEKLDCQLEKNNENLTYRLSSITNDSFFGDATGEPGNLTVQAHIDIKKQNLDDRKNLSKRTSSNISDTESKSLFDSSGNDFRSSDASSKNDSGIVVGSKFDSKLLGVGGEILQDSFDWKMIRTVNDAAGRKLSAYRDKLLFKEKELQRLKEENLQIIEKYKEVSESLDAKSREYERDTYVLREKLKTAEESKDSISASLKTYTSTNACLECELSVVRGRLKEVTTACRENYIPRLDELEKDLLSKTLEVNEANNKIAMVNSDLTKLDDLMERLNKLTIVVDECQKERDDLREQLCQCLEVQADLEMKLETFNSLINDKEDKLTSLEIDAAIVVEDNGKNYKRANELRDKVERIRREISSIHNNLLHSEESRKDIEKKTEEKLNDLRSKLAKFEKDAVFVARIIEDLDDKQNELTQVKDQLHQKEYEISLCKRNRDATVQKYDFLVRQLQEELQQFRELSLTDKESSNCPARTRTKFRVSESLKKFTRVGKNADGNWKPAYLRKKSTEEKSVASTSNFLVSRLSSSQETNMEVTSDDHEKLHKCSELNDETISSQTESDVDSNETDSRATSESSSKTEDDFEAKAVPSGCTRRCSMTGWMRIRRINARTVLPVRSDVEHDGDRSDS